MTVALVNILVPHGDIVRTVLQQNHLLQIQTHLVIVSTAQRVNHLLQAKLVAIALLVHIVLTLVIVVPIALPTQDRVLGPPLVHRVRPEHSQTQVLNHVPIAMRVSLPQVASRAPIVARVQGRTRGGCVSVARVGKYRALDRRNVLTALPGSRTRIRIRSAGFVRRARFPPWQAAGARSVQLAPIRYLHSHSATDALI